MPNMELFKILDPFIAVYIILIISKGIMGITQAHVYKNNIVHDWKKTRGLEEDPYCSV